MVGFAVFHVGGHPDNNGKQDFSHLLKKGKLWIGGRSELKKDEVKHIIAETDYFISYKSKKLYNNDFGWYDIYKKVSNISEIDTIDKWKEVSTDDPTSDDIHYFENNGVDYLINVEKVYEGKVEVSNLPNMRRIQKITNPSSFITLLELIN